MSELTVPVAPAGSAGAFSYAQLTPEQAEVAQKAATAIRGVYQRSLSVIGRHLLDAKEALPHGAFTAWAEQELGISERSARHYMQVARWLPGKPASVAALPPTVLYELSAPDAPDELVQEVLVMVAAEKSVNVPELRNKLEIAKIERADLKREQKRKPALTMAQHQAAKAKKRKEAEAQDAKRRAEQERVKEEGRKRLEPVVRDLIAVMGDDLRKAVMVACERGGDFHRFLDMLRAGLEGQV